MNSGQKKQRATLQKLGDDGGKKLRIGVEMRGNENIADTENAESRSDEHEKVDEVTPNNLKHATAATAPCKQTRDA